MTADPRPVIAITMGDPCGIGAEVIVKALADPEVRRRGRYIVFGLSEQLAYTADAAEIELPFYRDRHESIRRYHHDLVVLDYDEISLPARMPRAASKQGGAASLAFLDGAIDATKRGLCQAMVTAPISKASWKLAGCKKFPGHTELLAHACKVKRVAMMFAAPQFKVVLATIHEPLFDIRHKFTIGCVFTPIDLADQALREWFGIETPRIAVAGVNPHAGEQGHFGDEEQRVIGPAIVMACEAGINVSGPYPADTLFLDAVRGRYDCVIAMYHDQGLIPIKLLAWNSAVNLTLGLPIVRTSPDHGTAFDIAGRNRADPGSMTAAILLAVELAERRQRAAAGPEGADADEDGET